MYRSSNCYQCTFCLQEFNQSCPYMFLTMAIDVQVDGIEYEVMHHV